MHPTVDADSLRYLRIVVEAYIRWRQDGDHLGYAPFARVVGMPEAIEHRRVVDLSDDDFTLIDRAFAAMGSVDRRLMEVEYTLVDHPRRKALECGYGGNAVVAIAHYRRDVRRAEERLYIALQPHIDDWERAKPIRRKS